MTRVNIFSKEGIEYKFQLELSHEIYSKVSEFNTKKLSSNEVKELNNRIKSKDKSWT